MRIHPIPVLIAGTLGLAACGGGSTTPSELAAAAALVKASSQAKTPTAACSALLGARLPAAAIGEPTTGAVVTAATLVEGGAEYCRINGTIAPVDPTAENITFQVNLPTHWNHRALQYGGGGFDGTLITGVAALDMAPTGSATPLERGYVTFGDDSGHQSSSITNGTFAQNDEQLANYGGLDLKKTHDVARALIFARYATQPTHTYFFGSSTGGRDGLSAIQRWPLDYDGIVVNRPALAYTGLRLSNVRLGRALYLNNGVGWLDVAKTVLLENAVMARCDALDGATDGLIADVPACKAQSAAILASLRCAGGVDAGDTCLSDAQIATVDTIAAPLVLPYPLANGVTVYPGYNLLAGSVFAGPYTTRDLGTRAQPANPATKADANQWVTGDQWVKYFLTRDATIDSLSIDPVSPGTYQSRVQLLSALTDATNPDLAIFQARGGKIIMTHGLADEIVSTDSSAAYYDTLVTRFGKTRVNGFVRYFQLPGVGHGTGPFDPAIDSLPALEAWVERGVTPDALTMSDLNTATLGRTRPLCRYPSWVRYAGGDVNAASSFVCSPAA
ncbi:tannase/feruloyl esterase family alpha/beta hydrolase [Robbsia sp. Bb-Pol-6]|uniref:Tannase/feruloyl esterase family alpha/beta hydrolase n=1 Tax=Robbsia betulipollinis TaxID=2981849 RepID=A0ABT3ZIZ0_9BURK|nr:tannase/feruloyl esterase family alpha/beta hydrolase [Robbsia betulipollinis]MCY0386483.1 tannase/feruloyl esterase family alpha/beta hydrolase [Robbsia betulipollinis]